MTLAAETGIATVEAPKLVNVIAKAYLGRAYTSTQEQAWMLLAANALAEQAKEAKLVVNGAPVEGSAPALAVGRRAGEGAADGRQQGRRADRRGRHRHRRRR